MVKYMYDLIKGYHVEVSGNGYDLLIREMDNKVIAKNEGLDFYNEIEDMVMPSYKEDDYEALKEFGEYIGF